MVAKQDVFRFLEGCGVRHDDKVTVHCSLKAIGEIEGGADGLIDAFKEYLCDGLFIVPTHTWDEVDSRHPFYDVKKSVPCIGVLAKVAAFRPDGVRSLHPTHSVAAFGKNAAEYVRGRRKPRRPRLWAAASADSMRKTAKFCSSAWGMSATLTSTRWMNACIFLTA